MPSEFRRTVKTAEQRLADQQKRQREQEERDRIREQKKAKQAALKASWERISGEEALAEMLAFLKMRHEMVNQLAISGIGQVIKKDAEGNDYAEEIRFTSEQRVSQLDRLAGIDEAIDYIERHAV